MGIKDGTWVEEGSERHVRRVSSINTSVKSHATSIMIHQSKSMSGERVKGWNHENRGRVARGPMMIHEGK